MPRQARSRFAVLESSPEREEEDMPQAPKPPTKQLKKMTVKANTTTVPERKPLTDASGRKTIRVESNLYRTIVEPRAVFRYDVSMCIHLANGHVVDLIFKGNNNADITNRGKLCRNMMQTALGLFHIVPSDGFVVHDGAACLYSTEDLSDNLRKKNNILEIAYADLSPAMRDSHVHVTNAMYFVIEVTVCQEMPTLNTADYVDAQTNRDFGILDRTFKQFMDLLTSQDALLDDRFMTMRQGNLYLSQGPHEDLRCGHERIRGVDKGIKFVGDQSGNGVTPALVLDSKLGDFYKAQPLKKSVQELLRFHKYQDRGFPLGTVSGLEHGEKKQKMNFFWEQTNKFVKGLQVLRQQSESRQSNFTAIGITKMPISKVEEEVPRTEGEKQPVMARFRDEKTPIDTTWPAVIFRGLDETGRKVLFHYPIEMLTVKEGQKVPLSKQIADPSGAVLPGVRFNDINHMLNVLNLDEGGNELMKGFGITLEETPIISTALIREKPQPVYKNRTAQPEAEGNWRSMGNKFFVPADLTFVYVLADRENTLRDAEKFLGDACRSRGMKEITWNLQLFNERNDQATYAKLREIFTEIKNKGICLKTLVILIDDQRKDTHGVLKLAERCFQIRTMHMLPKTAGSLFRQKVTCDNIVKKMNEKCGGVNHSVNADRYGKDWNNSIMFIGYDVSHPTGESRDVRMNRAPPQVPSTIGFSFNGGVEKTAFIGDFHYQNPLQERVDADILKTRTKWMLDMFIKNRKCVPKVVYILRDGVSEGQYSMVMSHELKAIKAAFQEYRTAKKIDNMPKFNLYVVTKRHNIRLRQLDNQENLPAGSFVDNGITRNDLPEFFMQAHKAIKGTAKAPAIQCLVDEVHTTTEQDQSIMHALAYCHKIVDSPISLPEPVYMADEYAKRGKNVYNAYAAQHNFPVLDESKYNKEEYRSAPIDFEKMSKNLGYWTTELAGFRVNA